MRALSWIAALAMIAGMAGRSSSSRGSVSAGSVPQGSSAGWQVLKSVKVVSRLTSISPPVQVTPGGECQIAVPADWLRINTVTDRAEAHSPDGWGQARVQEMGPRATVASEKTLMLGNYKSDKRTNLTLYKKDEVTAKILQDSPTRFSIVQTNTHDSGVTSWWLVDAGSPLCYVQVSVWDTSNPTAPPSEVATVKQLEQTAHRILATFARSK